LRLSKAKRSVAEPLLSRSRSTHPKKTTPKTRGILLPKRPWLLLNSLEMSYYLISIFPSLYLSLSTAHYSLHGNGKLCLIHPCVVITLGKARTVIFHFHGRVPFPVVDNLVP
jgi:hypothetical protein